MQLYVNNVNRNIVNNFPGLDGSQDVNQEVEIIYNDCEDTKAIDMTRFNEVFKRADVEAIIKDRSLFLTAYCKAIPTNLKDRNFNVSQVGHTMIQQGITGVASIVELLRHFFVAG